jgi:hypothetical protein
MLITSRSLLVIAAAAALASAGAGCGHSGERATSTVSTASAAKVTPPQLAPKLDTSTDLEPGRTYTTRLFKPTISLTAPRGKWATEEGDSAHHISFALQSPPAEIGQAIVELHRVDQVFDPRRGGRIPGDQVPLRGSFATWLRNHPRLRILRSRRARLLGLAGTAFDIAPRSQPTHRPYDCGKNGPPPCVPLMFDGLDYILYSKVCRGRFTVLHLPAGGELVVEEFVQPASAFARGLRLVQPILQRLRLVS